jgi:5-dehydro-2-deoxygluconokinase
MDVGILGRIGYDLYAEDHNVPLKDVRRFSRYLGGSSANMAVGLRRLGLSVGIISCVGTDPLSDYLIEYLEHEGVDTRFVQRKAGYVSSLCLTEVSPPNHFPQVFYRDRPADAQVEVGGPEQEFIASTRLFVTNGTSLCASPSRESTYRALESAHRAGVRIAFDVDFRGRNLHGGRRGRCRPGHREASEPGCSAGGGQNGFGRNPRDQCCGVGLSSFISG